MSATVERKPIGLRVPTDALDEINRRAANLRLDRTEYMIRAALGELDADNRLDQLADHVQHLSSRLERLEQLAFSQ